MAQTVTVYCYDQHSALLDGVLVRVFNGAAFVTEDYTGNVISGAVEFTLAEDVYTIRLSKIGVSFNGELGDSNKSPQSIEVQAAGNEFEVYGVVAELSSATDSTLCRCSGYFKDSSNRPMEDVILRIRLNEAPLLAGDNLIWKGVTTIRSDEDGYISIDLLRGCGYTVQLSGLEDYVRELHVPARSSFNIIHLLFPQVKEVTYSPTAVSLTVDETVEVTPTITVNDTRVLEGTALDDVEYTINDASIATLDLLDTTLRIRGVKAGTTTLMATRKGTVISSIPEVDIIQTPVAITVS